MKSIHRLLLQRNSVYYRWLTIAVLGIAGCSKPAEPQMQRPVDVIPANSTRQPILARLPVEFSAQPSEQPFQSGDWFEDVAHTSGIRFQYRTGCDARYYTLLETVGGGVALFDYDLDGDLDVFLTGGGQLTSPPVTVVGSSCALYRNDGGWTFTDVTSSMGLASENLYTHGASVADYDRDGFPDLLVTGYGACILYRNDRGERFIDVALPSGLTAKRWFTSAAWGDVDRDGWVDLFAVSYADWNRTEDQCLYRQMQGMRRDACAPTQYPGQQSCLWRNQGDGTLADASDLAAVAPDMRSLGIVTADLDGDGWLDWFVANDVNENQLYWGRDQFPLEEGGIIAGVAYSETGERDGSMGTDIVDFDGDGKLDLFIANFAGQDNMLMRGVGSRGFGNVTRACGLSSPSRRWVKFASVFADFDLDGWPDLFVSNGHVLYDSPDTPYLQPAQLFRNLAGQRFAEVGREAGAYFRVPHPGRGAAIGDLDNDGAPDLVVVHQDQPVAILRNRNHSEYWVRISLHGRTSGTDTAGAIVLLQRDGKKMTQVVTGGGSYLSHSDRRVLFQMTSDDPVEVTVVWPGGDREVFSGLSTRSTHELVEGAGKRL